MSSSSEDQQINFFANKIEALGLNSISMIHPAVKDKLVDLDFNHFPVPWKIDKWESVFSSSSQSSLLGIATKKFELEGFILFGIDDPDCAHLYKILVQPELLRAGTASRMMLGAMEILKNKNYKTIYLEVEQSNFEALAFYRKHGYKVLVGKDDFYGSLRHAWAMELHL